MEYLLISILVLVGIVLIAHNPFTPIIRVLTLDVPNKLGICKCFIEAWFKNLLTIIPDITAPIVVAIALCFTKYEDNKLPWLFTWWDNDASINGDQLEGEPTYYAEGHDRRSFYARWVWLGLRNRASKLSQMLGYVHEPTDVIERWSSGDANGATKAGWIITKINDKYRYFETKRIGKIFFRFHYGYKIPTLINRPSSPVVAIAFSFQRYKG